LENPRLALGDITLNLVVSELLAILLALAGSAAGLAYAVLGITALRHLPGATQADRAVGWSLWWWSEAERYDDEGKRLCRRGGLLFGAAALCWVASVLIWRS